MYDLVIVGAGPAALSAAVYAARYRMKTVVVGKIVGGYANDAHMIENWLGEKSINGAELAEKFAEHVKSFDIPIEAEDVNMVAKITGGFMVTTQSGKTFESKRVILATGTERNKLKVKGEEEFHGKGVSYCATCDGFFFRNKTVVVVGGGDSAATAAILLGDLAEKVYLVHRRCELKACKAWQEKIDQNPKIEMVLEAEVAEIAGENVVKKVILTNGREIETNGVFIEVGTTPAATFIKGMGVETDDGGYIIVTNKQETNIEGVYAAGDITTGSSKLKQMVVAASEGAIATHNAYLAEKAEK